ncbi:kinase-like domain-containing protein [Gigaspora rosea]|uniref:Kinase-like domain-containing protein n=1 Tax=Gigaspora rosea TaxID=44941 RepID=A0A397UUD6_9GLOM|nr:kinase-like domain-containing protein [Gigaspora rosea]
MKYTRSRNELCGVNIKILHGIKTCDLFIKELTNYMQQKGSAIYGITQSTKTNRYAIVIPDEFNSRRNKSYGICKYCNYYNTSPAWCQSCDPWRAALEWTNKNKDINNIIKEFIKENQFKAIEYENVIEWISFEELINLKEIKEESELVFMATWVKGVRTIKGESGKFKQSRTISSVDLMKLNYSQTSTLELLENFKNHMQSKKYRIHGISQNTETGQYMLVIDFYSNKRMPVNGICEYCKRYNTSPAWCYLCDPPKVVQETSGDKKIDNCIKEFQLRATAFETVIEWIPFNRLNSIKIIGKGGFGTVYSSIWLDGKRMVEGDDSLGYVRYRIKSCEVALKTLPGSQTSSSEFLNEFKNHVQCRLEGSALEVYGLTQNTENGQYMMVYQYANRGNLHDFLTKNFRELVWQNKLKQLENISYDLSRIHITGLIHDDFHSGNILLNQNIDGSIISYITDLGLSRKQNEHDTRKDVYGVMPYVAPEILIGRKHTQEADIYSLGVIMAEVTTGKRPYYETNFDTELALDIICNGIRPEFAEGTPDCYVELAKQCMNSNPQMRPNAEYVHLKISQWKTILDAKILTDKEELDIKKKFIDADNLIKKTSLMLLSSPQNKYSSKLIDVQGIIESQSHSITKQMASSNS